jgi:hypothetical protein
MTDETTPPNGGKPPEKPPENPEGEKDTDTIETMKSDLDSLRDQLKNIKDYLPKVTITQPTGEVTLSDKFGYFTEPVAYASVNKAALAIRDRILKKMNDLDKDSKILIVDTLNSAGNDLVYIELLLQFRMFDIALKAQIDTNEQLIKEINESAVKNRIAPLIGTALLAAPYAVNALAEIAGYFRTDYKMSGREMTVKTDALITAIAGELVSASPPRPIYICNNYLLDIPALMTSKIFIDRKTDLNALTLLECVTLYFDLIIRLNLTSSELTSLADKFKETTDTELKNLLTRANQAVKDNDVILKSAGEFFKSVTAIETDQKQSRIGSAVLRDGIRRLGITHLLAITIPSSGGDTISERRFLRNSNKYLGGLVISYALATVKGEVLSADTVSYYGVMNYNLPQALPDDFTCKELRGK